MVYRCSVFGLILLAFLCPARMAAQNSHFQYSAVRPAVVYIKTTVAAEVNVPGVHINSTRLNQLLDSLQQLKADSIFLTPGQQLEIVLRSFESQPARYFSNDFRYFRHQEKVVASGSGVLISPDGYILTNCHVVDEGEEYIRRRFILSAFETITQSHINAMQNAWAIKFTEEQRLQLNRTFASVYSRLVPIRLEKLDKKIEVVLSRENQSGVAYAQPFAARIVRKGQAMPGKDIALLKIEDGNTLPMIPISGASRTGVGEAVFVYGYPVPVVQNEYLSETSQFDPTLTRGIVSAWKKTRNGWPVLQMDAAINHGNSGGPVCNEAGELIGITTFGSLDDNARALAPGLNFAIPVSVILEFLPDSFQPVQAPVNSLYLKGLVYEQKGWYRRALDYFQQVNDLQAALPGLADHLRTCASAVKEGKDREPSIGLFYFVTVILSGLFAVLFYFSLKKSRHN